MTQGIGDELGDDQDDGVGVFGCDFLLPKVPKEVPVASRAPATAFAERSAAALTLAVSIRPPRPWIVNARSAYSHACPALHPSTALGRSSGCGADRG